MEFLKNLFKDEKKVIGLCAFKDDTEKNYEFRTDFSVERKIYSSNYAKNFFLL